jgi:cation:H+ antiporter
MAIQLLIFFGSLAVLIFSANRFTKAAESIGAFFNMSQIVIGIFIVGLGTSLPELFSGSLSVMRGHSEILSGNIIGSNISNILLITGVILAASKKGIDLKSLYIFIDLHFLMGSFFYFCLIAYDGEIKMYEAVAGFIIFFIYSRYLISSSEKGSEMEDLENTMEPGNKRKTKKEFPIKSLAILLATCVGIYFGADYTVSSLGEIATMMNVPSSIIALTLLSLGTTLPELVVNIGAIRAGKAELALGNILGSCTFNIFVIPGIASLFGAIHVPDGLLGFPLPVMVGSGILFYMLTADKKMSVYEGYLFIALYAVFILQIVFAH